MIEDGFFGQEINHTNYNLGRMNMFLHDIDYDKFHIKLGNALLDPHFAPAGVLAPKHKADFAFIMHVLHHLSAKGRATLVCFPGIFYRGGAERKIRKYLIDNTPVMDKGCLF